MELTIDQALLQGVAAHKEGKLQEAERLYRAILQLLISIDMKIFNYWLISVEIMYLFMFLEGH